MEQQDNNIQNNNWFKTNAKWLAIIAVLVLIILVGSVKMIVSPPGKMSAKVESFKPTGEVPQTTNFSIEFSQDMVLDKSVGIQTDTAPIVFTPPLTGKYRWTARHILEFFPNPLIHLVSLGRNRLNHLRALRNGQSVRHTSHNDELDQ